MTALDKYNEEQRKLRQVRGSEAKLAGYAFEYKVMAHQEKCSVWAKRIFSDNGFCDVISLKKDGSVWYISCKKNAYWHPSELKVLEQMKEKFSNMRGNHVVKLAYYKTQKEWVMSTF